MTGGDLPLGPDSEDRRRLGGAAVEFVDAWIGRRSSAPASSPPADLELLEALRAPPPETGRDVSELLGTIDRATDTGFDTASGRFLSYIPSGALYTAALGAFVGSATNQYTGGAHASPGTVALEQSVIDWMCDLFGLPSGSGGLLTSGGSIANLVAVVAARSRLGDQFGDGVVYTSTRAHHSIEKAARIAGIAPSRVRAVETDDRRRLDPGALADAIEADRDQGLRPMLVAATAGTTDTGAVDPLPDCSAIAAAAGAWFHVDAAYGGFFQLTERGRDHFVGIEAADSITVDAHKSLFLPFGIGGLLVRDPATLVEAHEGRGAYMQDVGEAELPHYLEMGPELTRPNRGLPVWLALHLHGVAAFRSELDRMLDLAEASAERLAAIAGVELIGPPDLSVVTFRSSAGDAATRELHAALLESGEVHVSSTTIDGRVWVRFAFLHPATTEDLALRATEIVARAVA